MTEENKVVVEFNNVFLESSRGEVIFNDLNFKLEAGRSAAITGSAGSGKSSFIELIIGRQFANEGSVEIFSQLINSRKRKLIKKNRRHIGGVGGLFSLIPSYTVAENIVFPLILNNAKKSYQKERLMHLIAEFSLLKQVSEYPNKLTRVEKTLVQFARATSAHQPLVIIDEPLAGLDKKTYKQIYEYMVRMSTSGQSMIIVTGEPLPAELPNSDSYRIEKGALV